MRLTGEQLWPLLSAHNRAVAVARRFLGDRSPPTADPDLRAIRDHANRGTDISSHLETLFVECCLMQPALIVELGARSGESTLVFEVVARRFNATLVSVDLDSAPLGETIPQRRFVQADDIQLGNEWEAYASAEGIGPIDVLFIDTSHLFDHTMAELETWLPHLRPGGLAFLHDTNLDLVYLRRDGSAGPGWRNDRGVIKALEKYFREHFDERRRFERDLVQGWSIAHDPVCSGLTILRKPKERP